VEKFLSCKNVYDISNWWPPCIWRQHVISFGDKMSWRHCIRCQHVITVGDAMSWWHCIWLQCKFWWHNVVTSLHMASTCLNFWWHKVMTLNMASACHNFWWHKVMNCFPHTLILLTSYTPNLHIHDNNLSTKLYGDWQKCSTIKKKNVV
jgi:hypothetical protein